MNKTVKKVPDYDSQIILYCKGWFEPEIDQVEDLKKLIRHRAGLTADTQIGERLICRSLIEIYKEYTHSKQPFYDLLLDIIEPRPWKNDQIDIKHIISRLVSAIDLMRIKERADGVDLELAAPNYNLLPGRRG